MSLKYIGIVSDKLINYLAPFWPSRPSLSWRWRKKYFANIETSYQRIKCVKRQKKIDSWKTFNRFRPYRRDSSDISLDPSLHTCFVGFRSQNPEKKKSHRSTSEIYDFHADLELLVVDMNQTKQCRLGKFSQSTKRNVLSWYRITKTEANLPTWSGQLHYDSRQKQN